MTEIQIFLCQCLYIHISIQTNSIKITTLPTRTREIEILRRIESPVMLAYLVERLVKHGSEQLCFGRRTVGVGYL